MVPKVCHLHYRVLMFDFTKMIVEVFRTNVSSEEESQAVLAALVKELGAVKVNFDLEDCDRIMRIISEKQIAPGFICDIVRDRGFFCDVLPDEVYILDPATS